jgi:hypothetical protein
MKGILQNNITELLESGEYDDAEVLSYVGTVAELTLEVDNGEFECNYYNLHYDNGYTIDAIHAYHIIKL